MTCSDVQRPQADSTQPTQACVQQNRTSRRINGSGYTAEVLWPVSAPSNSRQPWTSTSSLCSTQMRVWSLTSCAGGGGPCKQRRSALQAAISLHLQHATGVMYCFRSRRVRQCSTKAVVRGRECSCPESAIQIHSSYQHQQQAAPCQNHSSTAHSSSKPVTHAQESKVYKQHSAPVNQEVGGMRAAVAKHSTHSIIPLCLA